MESKKLKGGTLFVLLLHAVIIISQSSPWRAMVGRGPE